MGVSKLICSIFVVASVVTASARIVTITEHQSACPATSTKAWPSCTPTNAVVTCGFDDRRDQQVGTVYLSDPHVRSKYYASSSDQWLVDDMPYLGCAKINHKRFLIGGVWDDDVSNFISNACTQVRCLTTKR
jgi:hypothetical protein